MECLNGALEFLCLYSSCIYLLDYLPVNFWVMVSNLFTKNENHEYYKVVPTEGSETYGLAAIIIGVILIIIGKKYAANSNT